MISHGHRWPDVQRYTLAQVKGFLAAIAVEEQETERRQLLTASVASALRGSKQTVERLLGGIG